MHLFPALEKRYTEEQLSAKEAQRLAEFIAWGPVVFQTARIMIKYGILDAIRDSQNGISRQELCKVSGLSDYAVKCLTEAALSIGIILVDKETDLFTISKTGWFLLTDTSTRANMNFNHDVNYEGWFHLEESLVNGKPEGLKHFGPWPTIYEGLSTLPEQVQKSWFGFDHFYSDNSFEAALKIVFDVYKPKSLFDVGGNTGRWALKCVGYSQDVNVTILDLPQQIKMMQEQTAGVPGADRIHGYPINLLDESQHFPLGTNVDAIWMSQFLDCFSMPEIVSILRRAKEAMSPDTRLYIMETLWDRQKFETAALCLTLTSLYFTALANGNSKMYNTEDMEKCITDAGLVVETIHDYIGLGHSIIVCKL
ncbi:MAG: methyltransferase domain-containing protein [Bacteroidales bacterium]|nr:methyltransferase domain-containing protein [Bacteroidales bacterium]